ncbi:MAG: ribosomal RNA small subunit methyltransferase A [Elusimicrobia bacterium CG06_land_8_20_14_3_00_38_11]|nr:MAG: ribosomal RNA small subunit methyltransferase A [Elusimicrobia bacterium CG06_land_8_20_14_3_00_38_11]
MRTRRGQNFLVDKNIAKKVIKSADILSSDTVIEIGPGKGILTDELSQKSKKIIAIEIDKNLAEKLIEKYRNQKNIEIINTDFLKWQPPKSQKLKFVANLPYYISSAIIEKILPLPNWDTAVFMLQKEVADRIIAQPGFYDYGVLSIACQVFCSVEKMFNVPGTCFYPKPKVTSTVVKLKRLKKPRIKKNEEKKFFGIVKSAFLHRRKTLLNSLFLSPTYSRSLPRTAMRGSPPDAKASATVGGYNCGLQIDKKKLEEKILQAGISPLCRAEMVSIDGFVKLSKVFP